MINKICKKCGGSHIKKDWIKRWKQRYKCCLCWYVFQNNSRYRINKWLWEDYTEHKQTYKELWEKYWKDKRTIRKELDKIILKKEEIKPQPTVLIIDTTYFWRSFWIMVFRSYELKKNLLWKEVKRETLAEYKSWIEELENKWWTILAIVCDWKKWLLKLNKPVQMCLFHQQAILRRYLTKNPILDENKELKDIGSMIWKIRKDTLKLMLDDRYNRNKQFLIEKNNKRKYAHERTRKAYKSIINNLDNLYIFKDYVWKIEIPSTSNCLESLFSRLKQRIRIHRWLKKERKLKLIDSFLSK